MKAYRSLYPELEDDRVCADISEKACHQAPKSYGLNLISGAQSKLAEQLASAHVVITWILSTLGAPYFFIALLVPIKEAGSMLPQLFTSAYIRRMPKRKLVWSSAALVQSLSLFIMFITLFWGDSPTTQIVITLISFLVFSIASGVASVSYGDVLGKTIPQGVRGQLLAWRSSIGGLLGLISALWITFFLGQETQVQTLALLILVAAILWIGSALTFLVIEELAGETEGGRNAIDELKSGLKILKKDYDFLKFLISRTFLLNITVSIPFFTLHAQYLTENSFSLIGAIMIALGMAQILSSPLWGKLSDKSARLTMIVAAILAMIAAIAALGLARFSLDTTLLFLCYTMIFFILGIAQAAARIGRKTYLVDYAPKTDRPLYIAIANSWMGIATIAAITLGPIAQRLGLESTILILFFINVLALLAALRMKET